MDYENWPREKLIEHVTAYSAGIHELANQVMAQRHKIMQLEKRLTWITGVREYIHGA